MAKFERYDSRNDASHIFDGGELDDDELEEEGSRLPLLLVIGLLVVAAFAGVVWLAYTQGVQRGRADAPRMLVASSNPVREEADGTANGEPPLKGLKIYQQPAPPQDQDAESAPQPPTPKAAQPVRAASNAPSAPQGVPQFGQPQSAYTAPPAQSTQAPATQAPHQLAQATSNDTPSVLQLSPEPAKTEAPAASQPAPSATVPAKPAAPKTATVASAEKPSKASAGSVVLQIGSYKTEDQATDAWKVFAPIADGFVPDIQKVDLGAKGTWYRLRVGSFADKTAALAFCDKLKADGGHCFLAK